MLIHRSPRLAIAKFVRAIADRCIVAIKAADPIQGHLLIYVRSKKEMLTFCGTL